MWPDFGVLPARVEELSAKLETSRQVGEGASSLSTAEPRLLPLLATHVSFPEIGQRLYVSRNTVKTQAAVPISQVVVVTCSAALSSAGSVGQPSTSRGKLDTPIQLTTRPSPPP